jgi:hypothetical protein
MSKKTWRIVVMAGGMRSKACIRVLRKAFKLTWEDAVNFALINTRPYVFPYGPYSLAGAKRIITLLDLYISVTRMTEKEVMVFKVMDS